MSTVSFNRFHWIGLLGENKAERSNQCETCRHPRISNIDSPTLFPRPIYKTLQSKRKTQDSMMSIFGIRHKQLPPWTELHGPGRTQIGIGKHAIRYQVPTS